jgi:sRNA-binding protein
MNRKNQSHVRKQGNRAGAICILLCLAMASPLAIAAQTPSQAPAQPQDQQNSNQAAAPTQAAPAVQGTESPKPPIMPSTDPVQRRKDQIAADTAQLDQLANELKVEMDKSTKDTLSLNVIKKAKEIEKLAHKLRDEISASLMN